MDDQSFTATLDACRYRVIGPDDLTKTQRSILTEPWTPWVTAAALVFIIGLGAYLGNTLRDGATTGVGTVTKELASTEQRPVPALRAIAKAKTITSSTPGVEYKIQPAKPSCSIAEPKNGLFAVSDEDTVVMQAPGSNSRPAVDASGALRKLDPRFELKIGHEFGDWIEVQTTGPNWPPGNSGWSGWIEKKSLLKVSSEDEKQCLFVNTKAWKDVAASVQQTMRRSALRILSQDARCGRIARGGPTGSPSLYFFTCYPSDGGKPYHYWLSAADKEWQASSPEIAMTEFRAIKKCRRGIRIAYIQASMRADVGADEILIGAVDLESRVPIFKFIMEYRVRSEGKQEWSKAYCLVPPSGESEVILLNH